MLRSSHDRGPDDGGSPTLASESVQGGRDDSQTGNPPEVPRVSRRDAEAVGQRCRRDPEPLADDPLWGLLGIVQGGPDDSLRVDEIVYDNLGRR